MILMHKDIPVADVLIVCGQQAGITKVFSREHMPVGVTDGRFCSTLMNSWSVERSVPKDRMNRAVLEERIGCPLSDAKLRNNSTGIDDCYWLKEYGEELQWSDVSFFANGFSNDVSDIVLFGSPNREPDLTTPDFTTNGTLRKSWIFSDGTPTLVKYGGLLGKDENIQSINEIVASRIAEMLGISHAEYFSLKDGDGHIICASPSFIHGDTEEFVSAMRTVHTWVSPSTLYQYYADRGMGTDADRMIIFDSMIGNTDRHEMNYGYLRDPDTLEIIGFAPLFDNGTSLGYNRGSRGQCKSFGMLGQGQLDYVKELPFELPNPAEVAAIIDEEYENAGISGEQLECAEKEVIDNIDMLDRKFNTGVAVADVP